MGMVLEGRSGIPIEGNARGQLSTHATAVSEEHEANLASDGYVLPINGIDVNGAEHIVVIKNGDDRDLIITAITLSGSETGRWVHVYLNESFTYAAGGTPVVPTNVKSGIVGGAEGEFYTLDAAGTDITTFTGTSTIAGIYTFQTTPLTYRTDSGWVVPKGQVWSLYNVSNNIVYNGHISFYYHHG